LHILYAGCKLVVVETLLEVRFRTRLQLQIVVGVDFAQ
jgi:hypothetical protein